MIHRLDRFVACPVVNVFHHLALKSTVVASLQSQRIFQYVSRYAMDWMAGPLIRSLTEAARRR